ncbi:hypothetical protein GCM10023223_23460 [Stackebrandtia albiflava]
MRFTAFTRPYYERGYAEGYAESYAEVVLRTLRMRDIEVSDEVARRVRGCGDVARLRTWFDRAFTIDAAEDVFTD